MGEVNASTPNRLEAIAAPVRVDALPARRSRPSFPLTLAGEAIEFLAHRAAHWPRAKTLLVADLHLGKCDTFRAAGAPIPGGILAADLTRIAAALALTRAERLLILGDLLHAGIGITPRLVEEVARWRASHAALDIAIIPGNHDRALHTVADAWSLRILPPRYAEGPFAFRHDPPQATDPDPDPRAAFTFCGHIHPLALIGARRHAFRLPCFVIDPAMGILPSFSTFTRGIVMDPAPGRRLFGIGGGDIFQL